MSLIITIKNDTNANFIASNKVLAVGELILTKNLEVVKIGDGVKTYSQLTDFAVD